MKSDDIFNAIGEADDDMIQNAQTPPTRKQFSRKRLWISATAAILVFSLLLGLFLFPSSPGNFSSYAIAEPEYPVMPPYPGYESGSDQYTNWREAKIRLKNDYNQSNINIDAFLKKSIQEFLSKSNSENQVFSPLNIYLALAMLAEITDGNSRQEILDVLEVDSIKTLRKEANAIWKAHYSDDGVITSILASSLWLDNSISYEEKAIQSLTDTYYASSFIGEMGSDEYNQTLRSWLNKQTEGLLTNAINDVEMDPSTVISLATTTYFEASWFNKFSETATQNGIFYASNRDVTCQYMNETEQQPYYWGNKFSAIKKKLGNASCGMWLILPDEGISVYEMLSDQQTIDFLLSNGKWENKRDIKVNLSLPKFDISSNIDLIEGMKNLGIHDIFDCVSSDFSPIILNSSGLSVSSADHSARVMIDEEGCVAAAMTVTVTGAGAPVHDLINFTLNRPFLFVITSDVGLPLFIGVVNQP